ncbi:hypothetical protein E4U51_006249 [Claviceps purpurea]|nr:hypothetical protein E4U51_006249 [Claviceps purpurea]
MERSRKHNGKVSRNLLGRLDGLFLDLQAADGDNVLVDVAVRRGPVPVLNLRQAAQLLGSRALSWLIYVASGHGPRPRPLSLLNTHKSLEPVSNRRSSVCGGVPICTGVRYSMSFSVEPALAEPVLLSA